MKFFSKSIFIVLLDFQIVSVFSGKVFIYFIYCFSVLFLSGSNSLSVNKEFVSLEGEEKRNKKTRDYFVEERAVSKFKRQEEEQKAVSKPKRQEEEQKARGLVLRFHHWPTLKEQKELTSLLKARGLKRTKNIKSFKAQLFGWEGGGLKPSSLGEKACLKLKSLSYVRRCSPDILLPVSSIKVATKFSGKTNKKTEAGFNVECENCKNQELESLIAVSQKALDIKTCNIVSGKLGLMEGKLSDYWAQELIGSDLLREELEKTPPPDIENWIAVFDTKKRDHNISVKNLISDEDLHAVLPELGERKVPFLDTNPRIGFSSGDYKKAKRHKSALFMYETSYPGDYLFGFKKRSPHYINNSQKWYGSEDIYEVFKELSSSGVSRSIVVLASGNNFPTKLDDIKRKASKDYDVILVGSFSPEGLASFFSQSSEELSILAPSDSWITSAGKNGEYKKFRGTSGATPLVTGSLAGFEWLSGYHPTAKEAKILLEKTALPTLHSFEKPPINGAGLLNAYKLGEVAKRLKKKCGPSISCFKEEILKDKNYHFPEDKSLKRDVARFFPFCSSGGDAGALSDLSSCEEKEKLFKRLRKAVLLKPSEELLKSLSCIYKAGGFKQNAEALDKLAMALGTEEEVRAKLKERLANKPVLDRKILRLALGMGGFEESFDNYSELIKGVYIAGGLGEKGVPILKKGFKSGDPELRKMALHSARGVGEKGLPLLEEGFASGDPELQKVALYSVIWLGEKGVPLLKEGVKSGVPELQKTALDLANRLGEKGLPVFKEGFASGDRELQKIVLDSVIWLGEKGVPLLKEGVKSGVPELQKTALDLANRLGEKGLPVFKEGFASGDRELQKTALNSVIRLGEKGVPLLKEGVKSGVPELQELAMDLARIWVGEKGVPILKEGFASVNLEQQKRALYRARSLGEKGLPVLKEGVKSSEWEVQELALYFAGRLGEKGLPLLEEGFKNGDQELQKQILRSARGLGEKGLPLLDKGFNSDIPALQKMALRSAKYIGEKSLPLLRKVLKNQTNLDEDIRRQIKSYLKRKKRKSAP